MIKTCNNIRADTTQSSFQKSMQYLKYQHEDIRLQMRFQFL